MTLTPGDGILMKGFKRKLVGEDYKEVMELSFHGPKPKDQHHILLYLGVYAPGGMEVDKRLNALGWVFDPERAQAELDK